MSDRKLREAAGKLIDAVDPHVMIVPWVFIDELSALRRVVRENEDPDVVEVLRDIVDQVDESFRIASELGGDPKGRQNIHLAKGMWLLRLKTRLQRKFHIRLTDEPPGWEYTE